MAELFKGEVVQAGEQVLTYWNYFAQAQGQMFLQTSERRLDGGKGKVEVSVRPLS